MKCQRAMEWLATGTALGRLMAQRHVARCPMCLAESERFTRIANALSTFDPLTQAQRALWTSASTEPRPGAARSYWPRHVRLATTAAVFVVGIGLAYSRFAAVAAETARQSTRRAHRPCKETHKSGAT